MEPAAYARELSRLITQRLADTGTVLSPADQRVISDTITNNARLVLLAAGPGED